MRHLLGISMLVAALGVVAACGGDDDDDSAGASPGGNTLEVTLMNWSVEKSPATLKAGRIKVKAIHEENRDAHGGSKGGATHQLVIARLESGDSGQGQFSKPLLNLTDIKPGESKSGEVDLAPGTYELACLVVEEVGGSQVDHYQEGMHTTVTVQ